MTNFKDFLEEQLKDDELRKEYNKLKNNSNTVRSYIVEYKRKYSQKEYIETPFGKSYGSVLLVNGGYSPVSYCGNEFACGHSEAMILLYDSGFVERRCPSCKRHETYYSLADVFLDTVDISVQVSKNKEYLNHMVYSLLGNLAFCVCKKTYSSSKVCNKHMDLLIKTIEVKKNWF